MFSEWHCWEVAETKVGCRGRSLLRSLPSNHKMTLTKLRQNKLFSLKSIISGIRHSKGKLTNAESDWLIYFGDNILSCGWPRTCNFLDLARLSAGITGKCQHMKLPGLSEASAILVSPLCNPVSLGKEGYAKLPLLLHFCHNPVPPA